MFRMRSPFSLWLAIASFLVALSLPAQTFSPWSHAENLGSVVNSSAGDSCLFVTQSGLSLYFASTRPGGAGNLDLYVSQRASRTDAWGEPKTLGATLNGAGNDHLPFITPDGHTMIFASDRTDGLGKNDLYATFRRNAADDFAWETPVRIAELSTSSEEYGPWGFVDPASGRLVLYFASDRNASPGSFDIFSSTLGADGHFSEPAPVAELNTSASEVMPTIRADGLELFLTSNRAGGLGGVDIFTATRGSTAEPWSPLVNVGEPVSSTAGEQRAGIFADGTEIYFFSTRAGGAGGTDLYRATRTLTTLVPIAGSTRGANGAAFRTSAQLSNPGDAEISGTIVFHPAGVQAGANDPRASYHLAPYESQSIEDVMANIGVSGVGSLEIVPESGPAPVSVFRIHNGAGSVLVPPVGMDNIMRTGAQSAVKVPTDVNQFRINVGVRTLTEGAKIWFCHHKPDGTFLGGLDREFPPNYVVQSSAAELLGVDITPGEMLMYTVKGGSAVIFVSTLENNGGGATLQVVRPFRK